MGTATVPRCYFSLRSPYSWLAYHDLVTRYPDVADGLEWRPFFEPDEHSRRLLAEAGGSFPYVAMSRAKHLYILGDVRRLAAARGLTPAWPVDRDPVWEVPHLAWFVADDAGRGRQFLDRVYRARWQEGRDICDPATVAALAEDAGVDGERAAGASEDGGLRRRGLEALLAIDRDGVFGVPFFVHRRERFWGVDRLAGFVAAVRGAGVTAAADGADRVRSPAAESVVALPPAEGADEGHAGGCG